MRLPDENLDSTVLLEANRGWPNMARALLFGAIPKSEGYRHLKAKVPLGDVGRQEVILFASEFHATEATPYLGGGSRQR